MNDLSPGQHQAIIWTNAGILLIEPLGTNFNEICQEHSYIFIQENAFQTIICKMVVILSLCLIEVLGVFQDLCYHE